jgi:hypothetical protein
MSRRDEFSKPTKVKLAARAAYLCSHPDCRRPTLGPAVGSDGVVNVGEAAHITAAATDGPRYNRDLSPDERRSYENGIWLCAVHAKQVDSDEKHFTVEQLRKWKKQAETDAFDAYTKGPVRAPSVLGDLELNEALLERLGLKDADVNEVARRAHEAAALDLEAFRSSSRWPRHAIALNLTSQSEDTSSFDAAACARVLGAVGEIALVAPPGTGKTTTAIQVVDAILSEAARVAVFVPLNEWSTRSERILESLTHRAAFRGLRDQDFMLLALNGRLALVLDGWNELDLGARRRALAELAELRRDYPLLQFVVTTRRQALDVPIDGPLVEIEPLTEAQQVEMARAYEGRRGVELVDNAWRVSGLRELVSIPLYLNALLRNPPAAAMPTTKEEILRLFVRQHEGLPENAEVLRRAFGGHHPELLQGLAIEAVMAANTAIPETRAKAVVSRVLGDLKTSGQINVGPEPSTALDLLVAHHTLVRQGDQEGVAFQHQQIDEWYASHEVEASMRMAAAGGPKDRARLREDLLNVPIWEEPILFATERLSRADAKGIASVAAAIREALTIDPVLAAQMIYRASPAVWEAVKDTVIPFVDRWHTRETVDRAVTFMATTGREEFAPYLWPLISSEHTQLHHDAIGAATRFRAAVLGPNAAGRLAGLPEKVRKEVLTEIAHESGMDGMELAAGVAKADRSPEVRAAVLDMLAFRRCERLVREILDTSTDETWSRFAAHWDPEETTDAHVSERIRVLRDRHLREERDPLRRIGMLLRAKRSPEAGEAVSEAIQATDFTVKGQDPGWTLSRAFEQYPEVVSQALMRRLEAGRDIPHGSEAFIAQCSLIDEGPIRGLIVGRTAPEALVAVAVTLAGYHTIGLLIEQVMTLGAVVRAAGRTRTRAEGEEHLRLTDLIAKSRLAPFAEAWLVTSATADPEEIGLLCDLFTRHGRPYDEGERFELPPDIRARIEAVCHRWAEVLLTSAAATRQHFAELAGVMARVASASLVEPLTRLLTEELTRRARALEAFRRAPQRGEAGEAAGARTSYAIQYERAFAAIGNEEVARVMTRFLTDLDFGPHAAAVLKGIHDRLGGRPSTPRSLHLPVDFSGVEGRRTIRRRGGAPPSSEAEAIFAAVAQLLERDLTEREQGIAFRLAVIGLSLPRGDVSRLIERLLGLAKSPRVTRDLLTALVLDGETVSADRLLEGIRHWLSENKSWTRDVWDLEVWLALLPFSDRPSALFEAFGLAERFVRPLNHHHILLSGVEHAPVEVREALWAELIRREPEVLADHRLARALIASGSRAVLIQLLDCLCDPALASRARMESWWGSDALAQQLDGRRELRAELLRRYENPVWTACHPFIEQTLAKSPDPISILAMVSRYAAAGRRFDGALRSAIEGVALEKRSVAGMTGAYALYPTAVNELRTRLFKLIAAGRPEAAIAEACLAAIDRLRDEHGRPQEEPRHPDIRSGRPWPVVGT